MSQATFPMTALIGILIEDGHEVTVIAPRMNRELHYNNSRLRTLFDMPEKVLNVTDELIHNPSFWLHDDYNVDFDKQAKHFAASCSFTLDYPNLFVQLRKAHFDLGISEFFDGCGVGIFHQIRLENVVLVSPMFITEPLAVALGIATPTAFVPGFSMPSRPEDLANSLWLRLENAFSTARSFKDLDSIILGCQLALDRRFPSNSPSLYTLASKSSLVFTNSDPLIEYPRPTLNKIVDIGGITMAKPKLLSRRWRELLVLRPRNVLISFGSVTKSCQMPLSMKHAIVEMVRRFPNVTFIWKYEANDSVGSNVFNLLKLPWFPQTDLLRSGRISVFVTHAGLFSVLETANSGTPFIAVGIQADQPRNALMLAQHGSGLTLSKCELSDVDRLEAALFSVLNSKSCKTKAAALAKKLQVRPFTQRELFSRHVTFVAANGPLKNTPISIKMSFAQLHYIDALALLLLLVIVIILAITHVREMLFGYRQARIVVTEDQKQSKAE